MLYLCSLYDSRQAGTVFLISLVCLSSSYLRLIIAPQLEPRLARFSADGSSSEVLLAVRLY